VLAWLPAIKKACLLFILNVCLLGSMNICLLAGLSFCLSGSLIGISCQPAILPACHRQCLSSRQPECLLDFLSALLSACNAYILYCQRSFLTGDLPYD
jgi:hypothetical protein